jgi:tryptophan 7-halogenase
MIKPIRDVVIVGGGSAGWIAAARIAAKNSTGHPDSVRVTLVESATIGTIGVGEGTWPTMRNTLKKIGISETEFIRQCDGAFKQGAKFVGWTDGTADDGYYHPLNPPYAATQINLSSHWMRKAQDGLDFANAVDFQAALCDAGRAPKSITSPEYGGLANYAYHLDAVKFATLLRDFSVEKLGVRHIIDEVTTVNQHEDGFIASIETNAHGCIEGDLFVDCSGFAALMIEGVYGVRFVPCDNTLFADHALALQVPYDREDAPIATHTISTAQDAGWIWDIGLPTRRGTGYVYSSNHVSHDEAEATLRRYVGTVGAEGTTRRIKIRAGHRETFWVKNCVAVGLSNGFLEPLEASALMLIETAVDFIADRLPENRTSMDILSKQFNAAFTHHWERIIEFLKLHYVLTKRDDTAFWRDNRRPDSIPDALQERLELWRYHPVSAQDFPHHKEIFSWPSYQYVMHGMCFETNYGPLASSGHDEQLAARCFAAVAHSRQKSIAEMPMHRDLLNKIGQYGLQAV